MKRQILHRILWILAVSLASMNARAWGETTSYVLDAPNDISKTPTSFSGTTYDEYPDLTGPGAELTFKIHRTRLGIWSGMQVHCYVNNNWEEIDIQMSTPGTSFGNDIHVTLPEGTTKIRLHLKVGCTLSYHIKDVKVTRATTLSTSTTTLDFGTVTNRRSSSLNAQINYNNTPPPVQAHTPAP